VEGGVAILLLLVLLAVGAAFALGLFSTGGALSLRRRSEAKGDASGDRTTHTRPTTPYHENTTFVGVDNEPGRPERPDSSEPR
jgi:hypothetical protein